MAVGRMSDTFFKRSRKTASRMVGGEMVILSVVNSSLFNLNEIASLLWQAADGMMPLRAIVERDIVAQFEVDSDTAHRDALELVQELGRCGILEIADQPLAEESR
jgi:hypothetical protein